MKRIRVSDRSETTYPAICAICKVDGKLMVATFDVGPFGINLAPEQEEALWVLAEEHSRQYSDAVAVVLFTHVAYANRGESSRQWAVDCILNEASKELGIPY